MVKREEDMKSDPFRLNYPFTFEDLKMLGYGRLGYPKLSGKIAYPQLNRISGCQEVYYAEAVVIAKSLE